MSSSDGTQRAAAGGARWALAIHGGAGMAREEILDAAREQAANSALQAVLEHGAQLLAAGGTSLDVVEQAACELEDSPLFNAGRGAAFNAAGEHELDASIMGGRDLRAGAVACVRGIKNPVALARLVMERSPHVFLQGDGAVAFARAQGIELVAPEYFRTEESWKALERARARAAAAPAGARHGGGRGARHARRPCGRDVHGWPHEQGAGTSRRFGGDRSRNLREQRVVRRVVHGRRRILHSCNGRARHLRARGIWPRSMHAQRRNT